MSLKLIIRTSVTIYFFSLYFCSFGQKPVNDLKVSHFDLRKETPQRAVISALHASKSKAVIVMTRGAEQELIDQVIADLQVLVHKGHERIVLVLAEPFEDDPAPLICIYAGGKPYAMLKNVKADASTSADLYQLAKEAYSSYVALK